MSRRVLIISLVFLFVLLPYSLPLLKNFSEADTKINYQNIITDTTWDLSGSPYIIDKYLFIAEGATLTIQPGVIVKIKQTSMVVNGKIIARGSTDNPIVFTSINDDSQGGIDDQSNNNPQAGDWGGFEIRKNGELVFDYVIASYGGYKYVSIVKESKFIKYNTALADIFPIGVISANGGKVEISNSEISNNIIGLEFGDYWVDVNNQISSQVSIHNSKIYDNVQSGVINSGASQIDATNNWWGSNSGPYNLSSNPNGQGNEVSNNVLFDPWIGKISEPKRNPVIIIPGILGSYLSDQSGEEVWPNLTSTVLDPWDIHLNKLALPEDGVPAGNSVMYPKDIFREILSKDFFQGLIEELENNGYKENKDLFVFPYDWRRDLNSTAGDGTYEEVKSLDEKIEEIKELTGANKVDIIAHSMGGLVSKLYIKKYGGNSIDKFIDIGTPHLGAPKAFKILAYGDNLGFSIFGKTILNEEKVKNISQNFPSIYQLLPSRNYFDNTNQNYKSYIVDIYDYDSNGIKNNLDYDQSIEFMKNTGRNNYLLEFNDGLHNNIDEYFPELDGIKTYNIVGCSKPTIGKIYILNKEKSGGYEYGLQYINGDGTVPLRSAEYLDADKKYYTNNVEHAYLPSAEGVKQLIASILSNNEEGFDLDNYTNISSDDSICSLAGIQIEYHSPIDLHIYDADGNHVGPDANGDIDNKIEGAQYDIIDGNKFVFLPFGSFYKIEGRATDIGTFDAHIKIIEDGECMRSVYFNEVPLLSTSTNIQILTNSQEPVMQIDQDGDGFFESEREPDAFLDEEESQDLDKPETVINLSGNQGDGGWYKSNVEVSLSSQDNEGGAGILKTEYSLDNGQNWIIYQQPFIIFQEGTTTVFYQAIDRTGNIEITKEGIIKIDATPPTVNIVAPYNGQEFLQSDIFFIDYEVFDNSSGVANLSLSLDGNALAPSSIKLSNYNPGEHILKIEAVDFAGNRSEAELEFNIIESEASIDKIIDDIEGLYINDEIYKKAVKETLIRELLLIKKYEEKYGERQEKNSKHNEQAFDKCIEKKGLEWCQKYLIINKVFSYHLNKIHEKIIRSYYQVLLHELDLFFKKKWLSQNAYDIIRNDITDLINNLK